MRMCLESLHLVSEERHVDQEIVSLVLSLVACGVAIRQDSPNVSPAVSGSVVYFGSADGNLYAVN